MVTPAGGSVAGGGGGGVSAVGVVVPFAVVVATADGVVFVVGDDDVGEPSLVPSPQAASRSEAAMRVNGRARNQGLLTL
jgi:hypothetical protein